MISHLVNQQKWNIQQKSLNVNKYLTVIIKTKILIKNCSDHFFFLYLLLWAYMLQGDNPTYAAGPAWILGFVQTTQFVLHDIVVTIFVVFPLFFSEVDFFDNILHVPGTLKYLWTRESKEYFILV